MEATLNVDLQQVAREVDLPLEKVQTTVELLDEGNTVPFITRFRKDQSGGLNEEQVRRVQQAVKKYRTLADRKQRILKSLEAQGKLADVLAARIHAADSLRRLEDLYLPFKPKKQTLAAAARARGLEPLAREILEAVPDAADLQARAAFYVSEEKGVPTAADALQGAGHLIAEHYSEDLPLRDELRELIRKSGKLVSTRIEEPPEPSESESSEPADEYSEVDSPEAIDAEEAESKLPDAEPSQSEPVVVEPADTEPADTEPADTEPADTEPADTEPAEPESTETESTETAVVDAADAETVQPESPDPVAEQAVAAEPVEASATTEAAGEQDTVTEPAETETAVPQDSGDEPAETGATDAAEDQQDVAEQPAEAEAAEPQVPVEEPAELSEGAEQVEVQEVAEPSAETAGTDQTESQEAASSGVTDQKPAKSSKSAKSGKSKRGGQPKQKLTIKQIAAKSRKEAKKRKRQKKVESFKDYFRYQEALAKVPPHRLLAINRGDRSKILRVKIDADLEAIFDKAEKLLVAPDHPHAEYLRGCVRDALTRLIYPSLEREIRRELTDGAESHAVHVFARNLRQLLLQPPVRDRRVLAIDPGFRSGCKLAAIDEFGNVLGHTVIHVIGKAEIVRRGRQQMLEMIMMYHIPVIAIGNGTACRETERLVADMIASELKERDVQYAIVNEAGASVYSTSPLGREELPKFDPVLRSAISIGRRLQDPLSELVKINPANIGVGLYQHDVRAKHLEESLDAVVESCVNFVGVDVNTASPSLLRYVSGLNQLTARRMYEYRQKHGPFRNRAQFKDVPGFGDATFVQAAGFLKIIGGDNPLDATWIHPESYETAERVVAELGGCVDELTDGDQVRKLALSAAEQARRDFGDGVSPEADEPPPPDATAGDPEVATDETPSVVAEEGGTGPQGGSLAGMADKPHDSEPAEAPVETPSEEPAVESAETTVEAAAEESTEPPTEVSMETPAETPVESPEDAPVADDSEPTPIEAETADVAAAAVPTPESPSSEPEPQLDTADAAKQAPTEPTATEPAATEPTATEPIATEPTATEPITTEPIATEPTATEPTATEPTATEPAATEPAATEPAATEPAVAEEEPPTSASPEPGASQAESSRNLAKRAAEADASSLAGQLSVGRLLLSDILSSLTRPGRDPREDLPPPAFRREIIKLEHLQPNMELTGTILNVVDFGAFVDIGLPDSGLIHISRLADRFVRDPHEVVSVGDIVVVWVVEVDKQRRRVSLTAIKPGTEKPAAERGERPARKPKREQKQRRPAPRDGSSGRGRRDRSERPKRTVSVNKPAPAPPITDAMADGKEPMRSFSDLLQFVEKKKDNKKDKKKKKKP